MTRVLVVDDDAQILRALRINLTARGYQVLTAVDGTSALRAAADGDPEVVVLDLGLPDLDGTEVIAGLRGWTQVPIIVLSARIDSHDKVDALDAGADALRDQAVRHGRAARPAARGGAQGIDRSGGRRTGSGHRVVQRGPGGQAGDARRRRGAPDPYRVGALGTAGP
jgi:CheY-like chemotaxis protein